MRLDSTSLFKWNCWRQNIVATYKKREGPYFKVFFPQQYVVLRPKCRQPRLHASPTMSRLLMPEKQMDYITRQALFTLSNSILVCNSKARHRNDVWYVEETWTETIDKMQ